MSRVLPALGHALAVAGSMTWQVTWSLILGFILPTRDRECGDPDQQAGGGFRVAAGSSVGGT